MFILPLSLLKLPQIYFPLLFHHASPQEYHCMGTELSITTDDQFWQQLVVRFYFRLTCIILGQGVLARKKTLDLNLHLKCGKSLLQSVFLCCFKLLNHHIIVSKDPLFTSPYLPNIFFSSQKHDVPSFFRYYSLIIPQ